MKGKTSPVVARQYQQLMKITSVLMELYSRNKQLAKAYQKVAMGLKPNNRITTVFSAMAFQVKNKVEDY